jgi:hypothetical protein
MRAMKTNFSNICLATVFLGGCISCGDSAQSTTSAPPGVSNAKLASTPALSNREAPNVQSSPYEAMDRDNSGLYDSTPIEFAAWVTARPMGNRFKLETQRILREYAKRRNGDVLGNLDALQANLAKDDFTHLAETAFEKSGKNGVDNSVLHKIRKLTYEANYYVGLYLKQVSIAKPGSVLDWSESLPVNQLKIIAMTTAISDELALKEFHGISRIISAIDSDIKITQLIDRSYNDPNLLLSPNLDATLQQLPVKWRSYGEVSMVVALFESNADLALTRVEKLPQGPQKDEALSKIVPKLHRENPKAAYAWVNQIGDEKIRDGLIRELSEIDKALRGK